MWRWRGRKMFPRSRKGWKDEVIYFRLKKSTSLSYLFIFTHIIKEKKDTINFHSLPTTVIFFGVGWWKKAIKLFFPEIKIFLLSLRLAHFSTSEFLSSTSLNCRIQLSFPLKIGCLFLVPLLPHNCKINKTILNVFLIENLVFVSSQIKQEKKKKKNEENSAIDFSVFLGRKRRKIFLFSMLEHKVGKEKKGRRKNL